MKVVVGIDIGSWSFKINAYNNSQFTLLTNQANFRQTPSLVAFHESHRLVGEQANNKIKSNYKNTIRAPMRLIGLEKNFDLIEEELKYATVAYEASDELYFSMQVGKDKKARLQPEHILVSLLSKVYGIILSHNLYPQGYYLVVPSYLSHYERKIIKRCGQIVLHATTVSLLDDWVSLAAQYAYSHAAEIKNGNRTVIFVDIGYSKCSFFVVEFTPREPRLLDCEHLRFMGSKNMDHLLAEHYDELMKTGRGTQESVFSAHKAKIKLLDQVEKQRKMLSANDESHISVEALFEDYDFSHDMKRTDFQKVVGPVLQQIRKGLIKIKSRMPPNYKPHSIQLVGGASRIPYVKTIIKEVFSMEASRTLNLSESVARGAAVYGAFHSKLVPLQYNFPNYNLIDICICWNQTSRNDFYGENEVQYKNKEIIFRANSYAPSEYVLPIGNQGPIELYIYYGQAASTKSIGYLRFNSPNRVRFILDSSKIVDAYLESGTFGVKKMQDKKETKWKDLSKWQEDIRVIEERINAILQLKNEYESKFYELRTGIADYKDYMSPSEVESFTEQFKAIEEWIENENERTMSTAKDLELYESQLEKIKTYERALNVLQDRKEAGKTLITKYHKVKQYMEGIPLQEKSVWQKRKLGLLAEWLNDSFGKMQASNWEGYYLTDESLKFAQEEVARILNGESN